MPKPLDRQAKRTLNKVIRAAWGDINTALVAYNTCTFEMAHAAKLKLAHNTVAQLCAHFEDMQYGAADDYTLWLLGTYEECAASLIEAVQAANAERRDERLALEGRYIVGRTLHLAGRTYRETTACNNPAVGTAYLDQWEHEVRRLDLAEQVAA